MKNCHLFDSIQSLRIFSHEDSFSFTKRLSRENLWHIQHAEKVTREYQKFLYLMATSDFLITPSTDIDQAWHLHLCYTRSYWNDFCHELVGKEIHHEPTKGGKAEDSKFHQAYLDTLQRYQEEFGTLPPADVWPDVKERFKKSGNPVWLSDRDFWYFRKSNVRNLTYVAVISMVAMPLLVACGLSGSGGNLTELLGTIFFTLVFLGLVIGAVFVVVQIAKGNGGGGLGGSGGHSRRRVGRRNHRGDNSSGVGMGFGGYDSGGYSSGDSGGGGSGGGDSGGGDSGGGGCGGGGCGGGD